jgi:hypothetical protein
MSRQFQITLPLVVWGEFEDEDANDLDYIKECLGMQLDELLASTDYLGDYWKAAQVEEV